MFQDERINLECGRVYRRGILLAVLYTALFAGARLLIAGGFGGIHLFLTEAAIILVGGGILLVGLVRWGFSKDERAVFEKHTYYLTAGKVFIIAALAGYAVSIPLRTGGGNDYPVNELILHLETLGCVYFFYAFKRRSVSFNYTFIDRSGWGYYRRVLLNIAKLAGILLAPFSVAAVLDLLLHRSFTMYFTILLSYAGSVVGLGVDYFLLSLLEKLNYDEDAPKSLKRGTLAALILAVSAEAVTVLLQVAQAAVAEWGGAATVLTVLSTALNRWSYPCVILTAIALCLLMEQTGDSKWVCRGVCGLLTVQAVELALRTLKMAVVVFLERIGTDYLVIARFADFLSVYSAVVWLLSLGFTCLWLYGLIRDAGASRLLWLTAGVTVLCYAVGIFFGSQSMNVAYALVVGGGGLVASAVRIVLLAKGNLRMVDAME